MTTQPPPLDIDESMFETTGLERMGWTDQYLTDINNGRHPLLETVQRPFGATTTFIRIGETYRSISST